MNVRGLVLWVSAALCGLAIGGCGEDDPEVVTVAFVGESAAPSAHDAVAAPEPAPRPNVALNRAVHWVEVTRCANEFAPCSVRPKIKGYCMFDTEYVSWETAMGSPSPECPDDGTVALGYDDALRGTPAIVGPITIGERPANAGWDKQYEPLMDGEVYAISAYVYEACDDLDPACLHIKAEGCQFFTVENGVPVQLEPTIESDDWSDFEVE
ncbi:MAG: hypothetical protein U0414_43745 [Polyangiaceae bacterium]